MRIVKLLCVIFIVIFSVAIFSLGWYFTALQPAQPDAPLEAVFTIKPSAPVAIIAQNLAHEGLIKSARAFTIYARFKNLDRSLRAGRFRLSPSMGVPTMLTALTSPTTQPLILTLPEGITLKEIGELILKNNLAPEDELQRYLTVRPVTLEGTLFPDTYYIDPAAFSVEQFFNTLITTFNQKTKTLQEEANAKNIAWNNVVTVASMLEKEIKTKEDLPLVAGIIWKRLKANWPLGIDATLLYDDDDGVLAPADLERPSPYNTRRATGLPPTPIANPGLITLDAALHPEESPYWFYLTTKEGRVIYAETEEAHEKNKRIYL